MITRRAGAGGGRDGNGGGDARANRRAESRRTRPRRWCRPTPPPRAARHRFHGSDGASTAWRTSAGDGMVINLWATWCVPCVAEMPALSKLAARLAPDDIAVMPLSSDRGGAEAVRRFYEAHAIGALPVLLDPQGAAAHAGAPVASPRLSSSTRAGSNGRAWKVRRTGRVRMPPGKCSSWCSADGRRREVPPARARQVRDAVAARRHALSRCATIGLPCSKL